MLAKRYCVECKHLRYFNGNFYTCRQYKAMDRNAVHAMKICANFVQADNNYDELVKRFKGIRHNKFEWI